MLKRTLFLSIILLSLILLLIPTNTFSQTNYRGGINRALPRTLVTVPGSITITGMTKAILVSGQTIYGAASVTYQRIPVSQIEDVIRSITIITIAEPGLLDYINLPEFNLSLRDKTELMVNFIDERIFITISIPSWGIISVLSNDVIRPAAWSTEYQTIDITPTVRGFIIDIKEVREPRR